MKMFVVCWMYYSPYYRDFGVCEKRFDNREDADEYLNEKCENEFKEWCADDEDPHVDREQGWARVERVREGSEYYEFKVVQL